ncbi:ABC transporter substrate-binding protein [Paenisporosarcina sp. TG-14]|uniref:ABC transporter substrate-binding protein n=1 Tax=Paenisporosarcina sp. TG-14 TaxID=1231057 RepID=UPI0002DFE1FC|nr:ABC transporter substrate-binding protein [Paenisporosarcina sp. TG-14]
MKKNRRWLMFFSMMVVCVLIISACSSDNGGNTDDASGEDVKDERKEIKVRINSDPDFLDPHLATASISFQMILNMFEGLLSPNTDGSLKPAIAESFELSDDGLTYTFNIRDNVTFHNGEPVTVEDIQYTFDRLMGTTSGEPLSSNFDKVASLGAPDDDTFVITLTEPNSNFLYSLTALEAAIVPESNDDKHNENPIGTGPFKFVSYSPGVDLVLEKNEEYWNEELPHLNKVTFAFQSDDQSALMALQADEYDLTSVPAHRISEVENDFKLEYQQNNSSLIITFNEENKPFDDVKVRQAVNHALSKSDIIDSVYSGYATELGSNMSPAMDKFYLDGLQTTYANDIEKGKELLAEAGYPDGFKTKITVSSHNVMYTNVAQVAVENLKQIGIDVEIEVVEWGIWLDRVYKGRDYEMTAIDLTGRPSAYDILNDYISTNDAENFFKFKNEEFDKIMSDVLLEADVDKQVELYQRAQEILAEEAAAVYIADYQVVWAMDSALEGFNMYPFFFLDMSELRFTE